MPFNDNLFSFNNKHKWVSVEKIREVAILLIVYHSYCSLIECMIHVWSDKLLGQTNIIQILTGTVMKYHVSVDCQVSYISPRDYIFPEVRSTEGKYGIDVIVVVAFISNTESLYFCGCVTSVNITQFLTGCLCALNYTSKLDQLI